MKIIVDLNDPSDVADALALLTGEQPEYDAPVEPAPPPARGPAARTAPGPKAPPARTAPAAGRPAPGRAPASVPARSAAPAGTTKDDFALAVQTYAKAHGPAVAKQAFAEYGASIGATVTKISDVPEDDYENAITYFPA